MDQRNIQYRNFSMCIIVLFFLSCHDQDKKKIEDILSDPMTLDSKVAENIQIALINCLHDSGKIDNQAQLNSPQIVTEFYKQVDYKPVWSSKGKWLPLADTLFQFIGQAAYEGLFKTDYHYLFLKTVKDSLDADSLTRRHVTLWTKAEILLTDAFMHMIKDLKQGRLPPDSLTLNTDSISEDDVYIITLNELLTKKEFRQLLVSLQPKHKGYWELKKGIKYFVDGMDNKPYTYISFPFKRGDSKDSLFFIKTLQNRLQESHCIDSGKVMPDSTRLINAIKKYQIQKNLQVDGKYGKNLISALNNTDVEKFKRIAVTLDKYRQLPKKMPETYIWVNIPGYYLWLVNADTVVFESKVICGKPETRTPLLNAKISDMITYPTWTVPNSIIVKQYLPKLKNNPNYISKIGLKLLNNKGEVIDPNTVNWSKYARGIPYKIMQASGDNNSLGVIKFNFSNPYAVYLHDTNQRYLFKNGYRALSHGCVRVQEWEKLAYFIATNDSLLSTRKEALKYTVDSIKNWISKKERHRIDVQNNIPLFIRYFSCEGKNGRIRFYDDVYVEDKQLIDKYYVNK